MAELCARYGIRTSIEHMAGSVFKNGDHVFESTLINIPQLEHQNRQLKALVGHLTLELKADSVMMKRKRARNRNGWILW